MTKARTVTVIIILTLWLLLVLPIWIVGINYEANTFRLPSPYTDRPTDLLTFYGPWIAIASLLISSIMKVSDIVHACPGTFLLMIAYSLWASSRAACFDVPCYTTELVIHFMYDEAWIVGLFAFPVVLGAILLWQRAAGRQKV
jgi:hypothetical protein